MDSSFKSNHLLLPELNYELRIRNTITEKSQDDKRKILGRLIAKERQRNFDVTTLEDSKIDFALEKSEIETTLNSIENLISDFEGPSSDSTFKRANSRLIHVNLRIQRIPVDKAPDRDAISKFKNESFATALKLEADLFDKVIDTDPNTHLNNSILNPNVLNSTSCPIVGPSPSKSIPVYKLGIQFDGNPKSALSFIEKIEEVALARNVLKKDLFQSASDLFTEKATFWYRQIKSSVNDWESLVNKLKKDFLPSDFEDDIWNQIKLRKQGRFESVVLFIACMETLFSRLPHPPVEVTKIKYIKQGLQVEYQKRLALIDIDSVDTLSKLCKRLEEADILSLSSTSSTTHKNSVDPELAYLSDHSVKNFVKHSSKVAHSKNNFSAKGKFQHKNKSGQNQTNNIQNKNSFNKVKTSKFNVDAVEFDPNQNHKSVCWNCGLANHSFRNCLAPVKTKFCFKCGIPGVTIKECKKCSGNA